MDANLKIGWSFKWVIGALVVGLVLGGVAAYLIGRPDQERTHRIIEQCRSEIDRSRTTNQQLGKELAGARESIQRLESIHTAETARIKYLEGKDRELRNLAEGIRGSNQDIRELVKRCREIVEKIRTTD